MRYSVCTFFTLCAKIIKTKVPVKGNVFFMKAHDSVANFKPTLRMYTNFTVRGVKKVVADCGPRECGSDAELKAQNTIAQLVGDAADEIKQDKFSVSPRAFLYWPRISGILLLVCLACAIADIFVGGYSFSPVVCVVLCAFILVMLTFEFLFYKPFLDPFFPKATSHNTYCVRKASGETKRRIVMCGHSDSSIEWRATYQGGSKFLYFTVAYPIVGLAYTLFASVLYLANVGFVVDNFNILVWIGCAFIPGYIGVVTFMNYKICVDGANDNLTGCFMGAAVMKYMGDNNLRFENTEVWALFSGGEESGLRGAKAFCKAHPELKDDGIETCFVAFDTMKDYDDMAIYNKDMSGFTKHDPRVCALIKQAGKNADIDLPYAVLFAGASDAAAVTQAGIPAALLAAMNPGPPRYYHTRLDKCDIMEPKTIEKSLEIALETAYLFDEQGLKTEYEA